MLIKKNIYHSSINDVSNCGGFPELFDNVIDTIGLEGRDGCSLDRLYDILKENEFSKSWLEKEGFLVKSRIWKHLGDAISKGWLTLRFDDKEDITFKMFENSSCPPTREEEQRFCFFASENIRLRSLGIVSKDCFKSTEAYDVLEMIGQGRGKGAFQVDMRKTCETKWAKKTNTDYYVGLLVEYGVISKELVYKKGLVLRLGRFCDKAVLSKEEIETQGFVNKTEKIVQKVLAICKDLKRSFGLTIFAFIDIFYLVGEELIQNARENSIRKLIGDRWKEGKGRLEIILGRAIKLDRHIRATRRVPKEAKLQNMWLIKLHEKPAMGVSTEKTDGEIKRSKLGIETSKGVMGIEETGRLFELSLAEQFQTSILASESIGLTTPIVSELTQQGVRRAEKYLKNGSQNCGYNKQTNTNVSKFNATNVYVANEETLGMYKNSMFQKDTEKRKEKFKNIDSLKWDYYSHVPDRVEERKKLLTDLVTKRKVVNFTEAIHVVRVVEQGVYEGRTDQRTLRRLVGQLSQFMELVTVTEGTIEHELLKSKLNPPTPSEELEACRFLMLSAAVAAAPSPMKTNKKEGAYTHNQVIKKEANDELPIAQRIVDRVHFENLKVAKANGRDVLPNLLDFVRSCTGKTAEEGEDNNNDVDSKNDQQRNNDKMEEAKQALKERAKNLSANYSSFYMDRIKRYHEYLIEKVHDDESNTENLFTVEKIAKEMPLELYFELFRQLSSYPSMWEDSILSRIENAVEKNQKLEDIKDLLLKPREHHAYMLTFQELNIINPIKIQSKDSTKLCYKLNTTITFPKIENSAEQTMICTTKSHLINYYNRLRFLAEMKRANDKKLTEPMNNETNLLEAEKKKDSTLLSGASRKIHRSWFDATSWRKLTKSKVKIFEAAPAANKKRKKKQLQRTRKKTKKQLELNNPSIVDLVNNNNNNNNNNKTTATTKDIRLPKRKHIADDDFGKNKGFGFPRFKRLKRELLSSYFTNFKVEQKDNGTNKPTSTSLKKLYEELPIVETSKLFWDEKNVNFIHNSLRNKIIWALVNLTNQQKPLSDENKQLLRKAFNCFNLVDTEHVLMKFYEHDVLEQPYRCTDNLVNFLSNVPKTNLSNLVTDGLRVRISRLMNNLKSKQMPPKVLLQTRLVKKGVGFAPSMDTKEMDKRNQLSGAQLSHLFSHSLMGNVQFNVKYPKEEIRSINKQLTITTRSPRVPATQLPKNAAISSVQMKMLNLDKLGGNVDDSDDSKSEDEQTEDDKKAKYASEKCKIFEKLAQSGQNGIKLRKDLNKLHHQVLKDMEKGRNLYLLPNYDHHIAVAKENCESKGNKSSCFLVSNSFLPRKWSNFDGTCNTAIKRQFEQLILLLILKKPGIDMYYLASEIAPLLDPIDVKDLLDPFIGNIVDTKLVGNETVYFPNSQSFLNGTYMDTIK